MKFVIFHGSFGSPEGNWFPQLKESLENLGQEVVVPSFPVEDWDDVVKNRLNKKYNKQNLNAWYKAFEKVKKGFKKNEKLCFIGHSLAPLFILHVVDKYNIKLDSAIFVSPFLSALNDYRFDLVNKTFYKTDFDFDELRKLIPISYVLYSENDPYVPSKYPKQFAELMHSALIPVTRAGHINLEVNLNELPLVYELCKTRLNLTLYQKYLAHRRELFAVPYTKTETEEIVYLAPEGIYDEGKFHFRNLRNEGFCTFYTKLKFWDPKSAYMVEARKAAKRVPISRVFIADKLSDLASTRLLEQLKLDIAGGIRVYLCTIKDIKKIKSEQDFGLWDQDYVCTETINKSGKITKVKLSSREIDIARAQKWKKEILQNATRIHNADKDVAAFVKTHS